MDFCFNPFTNMYHLNVSKSLFVSLMVLVFIYLDILIVLFESSYC